MLGLLYISVGKTPIILLMHIPCYFKLHCKRHKSEFGVTLQHVPAQVSGCAERVGAAGC